MQTSLDVVCEVDLRGHHGILSKDIDEDTGFQRTDPRQFSQQYRGKETPTKEDPQSSLNKTGLLLKGLQNRSSRSSLFDIDASHGLTI